MSELQRIISQQVYQWNRSRSRKKNGQNTQVKQVAKIPQVVGFRVEGNKVKNPVPQRTHYGGGATHSVRRGKVAVDASLKRVLGIALVVIGCLLLLSKCFVKDTAVAEEETQAIVQPFEAYIQDFDINEEHLKKLLDYSREYQVEYAHALAVWALESYRGTEEKAIYKKIDEAGESMSIDAFGLYADATNVYKQFIYDIDCFPVEDKESVLYENGWKETRNFNGSRMHYGIDLMSKTNQTGVTPIRSMTDGVIENIGWNQVGGYRVGVRTDGGAYFYYAHLDQNPTFLKKGDRVKAGECIGYMGDTGYGEEGTRGLFPVHLHVGVAVRTQENKEYWINPYFVLQYLEKYGRG